MMAPIVLFVYNRPAHTERTLSALKKNTLAQESDLIIYSDAAKTEAAFDAVADVRRIIRDTTGFRSVTVREAQSNKGLAASIIDGVTSVINEYGSAIVLEDDIETSPYFLKFMNDALSKFQGDERVWHISGWNYPIDLEGLPETFFWRVMNCWGWATWADRWRAFEKKPKATSS